MRILIVVPSLKNQAPIKIALTLAEGFYNSGHEVKIIYFDEGVEVDVLGGIETERVSFKFGYDFSGFDIVHSHLFRADLFLSLNRLFSKNKKIKTVTTLHNYVYKELRSYYNFAYSVFFGTIWNISWLNFDVLIALTEDGKNYYDKVAFENNIKFIHNGHEVCINYDSFDFDVEQKIMSLKESGYNIIGSYCNLTKRKRIDWLVRHVARNKKNALVIIGDGAEKATLENLAKELSVDSRVVFIDSREDAHQYNYYFDVYCIPSIHEGFGLALIEAALHKKKIVCSDIPAFKELFSQDEVFFFKSDDFVSLDDAILLALQSDSSHKAFHKARSNYSKNTMVKRYLAEYARLLRG